MASRLSLTDRGVALSDRRTVVAIALLCCFLWGSAVPAVKFGYGVFAIAPSDTPALMLFAGTRFVLAGLILLIIARLNGHRLVQPTPRMAELSLLGLVSTAAQYLFFYVGLAHSTGVKTSIISSTSTFFSVLLAHILFANDKLSWRRALGCLCGFAGVIAVNLSPNLVDTHVSLTGEGFVLVAAALFSIGTIYGRSISQSMDTGLMTGWQLLLGGLALAVAGLALGGRFSMQGWQAALLLGYLAALSAAAFSLWGVLLKHNPVGLIAIFNCAIPIFGIFLSGLVLGESVLEWKNFIALALVIAGIYLVTTRGRRTA